MKPATFLLTMLFASTLSLAQHAHPQTPQTGAGAQQGGAGGQRQGMMQGAMADRCKAMMAKHDQMMAEMKKMDATLDEKLQAMRSARGESKVEAMAAVITEMVEQRRQGRERMMEMQHSAMQHMSEHMAQGGVQMQCPMMSQMSETKRP
ncbi:MAG TPA: hypothetical protein VN428_24335 [Bryobacteraceae bacterium]|nr:hypothetical protein [Bryobacteraceae bacterium]